MRNETIPGHTAPKAAGPVPIGPAFPKSLFPSLLYGLEFAVLVGFEVTALGQPAAVVPGSGAVLQNRAVFATLEAVAAVSQPHAALASDAVLHHILAGVAVASFGTKSPKSALDQEQKPRLGVERGSHLWILARAQVFGAMREGHLHLPVNWEDQGGASVQ